MSATVTPRDFMLAAYGLSTKNSRRVTANEDTELFEKVKRILEALFSIAAEVNYTFFAETATVAYASPGWARPENAETIFYKTHSGAEVVTVPFGDRTAEIGKKAVYELGGIFRSAGNALDPVTGDMVFYYSRRPAAPADADSAVDPSWPEAYNDLVIQQLALYLATKDGRAEELAGLTAGRDAQLALFVAFLEHATADLVRRYGHVRVINNESLTRFKTMLGAA